MSGQGNISAESNGDVEPWDPRMVLRTMDPREARLANGFLRCHPERWCPGLAERWTPLMSTLGCELRLTEIKPSLSLPSSSHLCFRGALDQEQIIIGIDEQSANTIAGEIIPRVTHAAHITLIIDYIIQRFVAVLGMCQIVSESAGVRYFGRCAAADVPALASVRLSCSLQSTPCSITVGLTEELVDKMDKLWRRQVQSSSRLGAVEGQLHLEVAQLGVPPQMLAEYLTKGTVIDLETRVSDSLTLRLGHKVFMPAKMLEVEGRLACQTIQGGANNISIPEGTSRLSIELASVSADAALVAELGQVGAVLVTDSKVTDRVALKINQERVAEARLCVYQGRYAVEVV